MLLLARDIVYTVCFTLMFVDTREMARSLGKLNEDDLRWIGSERGGAGGSHERLARAGSGSVLPESIPEEGGMGVGVGGVGDRTNSTTPARDTKQERMERIRKLRDRDSKFTWVLPNYGVCSVITFLYGE